MSNESNFWRIVGPLGVTQIISWGSLFYAFALLAPQIRRELGWGNEVIFGAFSWSMLVSGLTATPAGLLIDRFGGRLVMGAGSLICGIGLVMLSLMQTPLQCYGAWTLLGVGMAMVLYEAAFSVINREFMLGIRTGISALTLFGGFASTVFWPLSLQLDTLLGWRDTYLVYGGLHLALCLPLHLSLPQSKRQAKRPPKHASGDASLKQALRSSTFWLLALAFASNSFIFSALSVHLISILHALGHPVATVVFLAAFIGPMQVAGRLAEMLLARRIAPDLTGKITFAVLPAALAALLMLASHQWAVALFCVLYGLSNGVLTIVRGTVPQTLFGRENYGAISGAMAAPGLMAKAAGPLAVGALFGIGLPPTATLAILLAISLISLGWYLAALKKAQRQS